MKNRFPQVVILAGGAGQRFQPISNSNQKCMYLIDDKPFLVNIIFQFKKFGARNFLILTGYKENQIEEYFRYNPIKGIHIKFHYSKISIKTAKRLFNAFHLLEDIFFLNYGDIYSPINLKKYLNFFKKQQQSSVVCYKSLDKNYKNNVKSSNLKLLRFTKQSSNSSKNNFKNVGYFIIKKNDLNFTKKNFYFEHKIKQFLKANLKIFVSYHNYYTLTDIHRLSDTKIFFSKNNKYILLDRDGVINKKAKKGFYITNKKKFILKKNVLKALKLIQKKRYRIIIITNQAGVSRKLISKKNLDEIHNYFLDICFKNNIFNISAIYFSTSFNNKNFYRKPNPGMIYLAENNFKINPYKTYLCGDDIRDENAANSADFKFLKIEKNKDLYFYAKKI